MKKNSFAAIIAFIFLFQSSVGLAVPPVPGQGDPNGPKATVPANSQPILGESNSTSLNLPGASLFPSSGPLSASGPSNGNGSGGQQNSSNGNGNNGSSGGNQNSGSSGNGNQTGNSQTGSGNQNPQYRRIDPPKPQLGPELAAYKTTSTCQVDSSDDTQGTCTIDGEKKPTQNGDVMESGTFSLVEHFIRAANTNNWRLDGGSGKWNKVTEKGKDMSAIGGEYNYTKETDIYNFTGGEDGSLDLGTILVAHEHVSKRAEGLEMKPGGTSRVENTKWMETFLTDGTVGTKKGDESITTVEYTKDLVLDQGNPTVSIISGGFESTRIEKSWGGNTMARRENTTESRRIFKNGSLFIVEDIQTLLERGFNELGEIKSEITTKNNNSSYIGFDAGFFKEEKGSSDTIVSDFNKGVIESSQTLRHSSYSRKFDAEYQIVSDHVDGYYLTRQDGSSDVKTSFNRTTTYKNGKAYELMAQFRSGSESDDLYIKWDTTEGEEQIIAFRHNGKTVNNRREIILLFQEHERRVMRIVSMYGYPGF